MGTKLGTDHGAQRGPNFGTRLWIVATRLWIEVGIAFWTGHGRRLGALASAFALAVVLGATCAPQPLAPHPGLAAWREPAAFAARDGVVDLAGGNLLLRRTDLTIETRLGTQAVTQVYNSATDRWSWSFEMTYAGGVFRDDTGALHLTSAPGPVPGTRWRVVDATTVESRGGLRFSFAPDGRLERIAWRHASYPRLELQRPDAVSLRIAQCTAPGACTDVFLVRYQGPEVVEILDRAGRQCTYGWDRGRLAWVQTAFGREQGLPVQGYAYELDAQGRRPGAIVVTNPEQERVRYELDPLGRTLAMTLLGEESPRWGFRHDATPLRTVVTDPLGRTSEFVFDASHRLLAHTNAMSERTELGWTGARVTSVRTPDGLVTSARYDATDELVESTPPSGRRIQIEYAPGTVHLGDPWTALPRRIRDGGGVLVERSFDAQGRLVSERNGAGEEFALEYGPLETVARVTLADGRTVHLAEYGEHGQPAEVRLPAAHPGDPDFVAHREFDAVGNLTIGVDPGSESGTQFPGVVARVFDAARQVRSLVMSQTASGGQSQDVVLERRSDGRLRAILRPYGATTELDYDALGRLRSQRERVDGAWRATQLAWTALGELARVERPNGMTTELAHDATGRTVWRRNQRPGAPASEVGYAYAQGRLVRKDDSTVPGSTEIAYDAQGRVLTVTWPDGERSWFGYDGRDRPTSAALIRADGELLRLLGIRYDAAGREAQLLDGAAVVYEKVYGNGRLEEIRHGNGIVRSFSYDEFGRLAGAVSHDGAGREVERETIERIGRDLSGPAPNGPFRETNARYQAPASFGAVAFMERAIGFRYVDGRRWPVGLTDSGTVYWCNGPACEADDATVWNVHSGLMDLQFESETDGDVRRERHFVTNPERNRLHEIVLRTITSLPRPCSPCTSTTEVVESRYEWDAAGFATRRNGVPITWDATGHVASFGGASFQHDAEGRLRGSVVAGVVRKQRFGGLVEADANGDAVRIDLGAVDIDLVANRRSYRHFDWRGNVRSRWSETGELRSVREYTAYGPDRVHGEPGDERGFAQGQEAAGLVLLGDRLYDPAARRFLSPDPIYNAVHQYVYGAGDPAHYWDWTGRRAQETVGFQMAGAFGRFSGAAVSVGTGLVASLLTGNPLFLGAGAAMASHMADLTGKLYQLYYTLLYDWITGEDSSSPPESTGNPLEMNLLVLPFTSLPVSGPGLPHWIGPGERPTGSGWRNTPPPSRGLGFPSIHPALDLAAPAPGCGLLGAEPLLLILWCLGRASRRGAGTHCRS